VNVGVTMAARELKKLSAAGVSAQKTPGRYADGGGLYLIVDKGGAKRWAFIFRWEGKLREMGLGGVTAVSLAKAREKAAKARDQLDDQLNPIEVRRQEEEAPTFGAFADEVVGSLAPQWRNDKHIAGWKMTLAKHAQPLRSRKVDAITVKHVLDVLTPLAETRPETASRLRGRIERVLDAARAKGHIRPPWENPARWQGNLKLLMPTRQKLSRGHHKALPFEKVPEFVAALQSRDAMAALALEFTILTAARTNEVIGATWAEMDLKTKIWTVPAVRMKAGREHRVPLGPRAVAILEKARKAHKGDQVFPAYIKGPGVGRPKKGAVAKPEGRALSTNAMRALLLRMDVAVTVHGFRSAFSDWAGETTEFAREIVEAALAHTVGDATERAYRRGDALERRRKLMEAWEAFCLTPIQEVDRYDDAN
jgi:integrase